MASKCTPVQLENNEAEVDTPCVSCNEVEIPEDNPMLLCDNCDAGCHVKCAGLKKVPKGSWFCKNCPKKQTRQRKQTPQKKAAKVERPSRQKGASNSNPPEHAQLPPCSTASSDTGVLGGGRRDSKTPPTRIFICDACDFEVETRELLKSHKELEHSASQPTVAFAEVVSTMLAAGSFANRDSMAQILEAVTGGDTKSLEFLCEKDLTEKSVAPALARRLCAFFAGSEHVKPRMNPGGGLPQYVFENDFVR